MNFIVLAQCHLDTDQYSFHSLRRGGATCASAAGCSDNEICTAFEWNLMNFIVFLSRFRPLNINYQSFMCELKISSCQLFLRIKSIP
jgi:hypothetical protein